MSEFKELPVERNSNSDSDDNNASPNSEADRSLTPAAVEVASLHPPFVAPSTPSVTKHKQPATGPDPVVDVDGALSVDARSARGGSRGSKHSHGDDILNEAEVSAASVNIDAPPFPLELRFEDLSYFVQQIASPEDQKERQVLFNVNGLVKPGELLAIMGPTGAGKSSLLNILAGQTKTGIIRGRVLYNDRPRTKMMKRWSAYVLQDDTFFSQLTVRETLTFSAMVRLPSSIPKAEKLRQVDRVIKMLNLEKCQHTLVGGQFMRGVSGGERRRLNIGNEILNNPSLLLCDEPTSGLDSSTAHTVLQTLVGLARSGRSVVVTIHQPSSRMFSKFDKLLLLAQGKTIFYGPANKVTSYLAMQGFPAPSQYNPADFILELVTEEELAGGAPKIDVLASAYIDFAKKTNAYELPAVDRPLKGLNGEDLLVAAGAASAAPVLEVEMSDMRRASAPDTASVGITIQQPPAVSPMILPTEAHHADSSNDERWATTFFEQLVALTIRSYKQQRGERITGLYFWQFLSLALIVGLVWFQIPNTEGSLQDKTGYLFFEAIFWSMNGLFTSLTNFPAERAVLMKERASGSYRVSAYFIAKTTSEIPVEMIFPTLYCIISYWMAGLAADGGKFISNWLTILLSMLTAQSVGLTISAAVMDFKKSIVVASVGMLGLMLISGFYVNGNNLPVWIKWVQYLAFMKYSYAAVAQIEFTGLSVACATSASSFTQCIGNPSGTIPGEAVLAFYDLNSLSVGANIGILFAFLFGFRVLAYVCLRRNKS